MEMGAQEPNFVWLLAFNAFLAYFTNLTNFLVRFIAGALQALQHVSHHHSVLSLADAHTVACVVHKAVLLCN
jgi:hypothetical protein